MEKTPQHLIPIIAIVGRPNVGKSSLFNRLVRKRIAITSEVAGTTRDSIYHRLEIGNLTVVLVDTGGMEYGKKEDLEADVQTQARLALKDADIVLFVTDATETLTANDYEAAQILRKTHKPIITIANKYDHNGFEENIDEMIKLGFGEPLRVSVIHKIGIEEIFEALEKALKKQKWKAVAKVQHRVEMTNVCFVGRPNVGKSSLVNALLGEEKLIVSPVAGTTRDAVDLEVTFQDKKYNLIDTAGIRRRGKIEQGLEKLSTFRSLEAIERADVVGLILDCSVGISKQDLHISSYITEAGKGLLLIVNKSDLMSKKVEDRDRFIRILRYKFDFLPWAPVIFVSALKKTNVDKILELAQQVQEERSKQIDNDELDGFMKEVTFRHTPPTMGRNKAKIYSLEQVSTFPPTFVYMVSDAEALHFSYRRYLENELRKKYGFNGTSLKLIFRDKKMKKAK